jgi:hypothetical protein
MKSPDVNIEICLSLIREFLSGYRGYPPTESGERRFAFALQENCISVGHARAVLQSFDEVFPTVRQIHDAAFGIRPQFEPADDQRREWERQYGKPVPFNTAPADELAMKWQAIRDTLYYTEGPGASSDQGFWERAHDVECHPQTGHLDTVVFVRQQVAEMGWPAIMALASSPASFPYTDRRVLGRRPLRGLVPVGAPITQSDIDDLAKRKAVYQMHEQLDNRDAELDGWDDPDR